MAKKIEFCQKFSSHLVTLVKTVVKTQIWTKMNLYNYSTNTLLLKLDITTPEPTFLFISKKYAHVMRPSFYTNVCNNITAPLILHFGTESSV